MAKRSKWTSKGWWKHQGRRPRAAATKAMVSVASRAKALWLQYFPTRLSYDELFAKLTKDVVEIKNHITMAFKYRKIFRDTTEMLQKHPTLSTSPDAAYWYDWLRTIYAHYIVMSVRRELDRGATSPNLFRLLHEISKRPEILSRSRYESFFEGTVFKEHGLNVWDTQFSEMAGPGAFIDPKVVRSRRNASDGVLHPSSMGCAGLSTLRDDAPKTVLDAAMAYCAALRSASSQHVHGYSY